MNNLEVSSSDVEELGLSIQDIDYGLLVQQIRRYVVNGAINGQDDIDGKLATEIMDKLKMNNYDNDLREMISKAIEEVSKRRSLEGNGTTKNTEAGHSGSLRIDLSVMDTIESGSHTTPILDFPNVSYFENDQDLTINLSDDLLESCPYTPIPEKSDDAPIASLNKANVGKVIGTQTKNPDSLVAAESVIEEPINVAAWEKRPHSSILSDPGNFAPPRRHLRPRTLKQMKPYSVDRFEHQAQIQGDAKRAMLIENAAAEQDMELLETLKRADREIRERRMMEAIEREKKREEKENRMMLKNLEARNKKQDKKKHKHINNKILDGSGKSADDNNSNSDSDTLSEPVSYKENRDILEKLLNSHSSANSSINGDDAEDSDDLRGHNSGQHETYSGSSTDNGESDSDTDLENFGYLRSKLSKYQVLPRSYIRHLKTNNKTKKDTKAHQKDKEITPRKGLAVRKLAKLNTRRGAADKEGSFDWVDDNDIVNDDTRNEDADNTIVPNPYDDDFSRKTRTDFENIISKYGPANDDNDGVDLEMQDRDLGSGSYFSDVDQQELAGSYIRSHEREHSSRNSYFDAFGSPTGMIDDPHYIDSNSDVSLENNWNSEDGPLEIRNSSDLEILDNIESFDKNKTTGSYSYSNTLLGSDIDDGEECAEDRRTGIDMMLTSRISHRRRGKKYNTGSRTSGTSQLQRPRKSNTISGSYFQQDTLRAQKQESGKSNRGLKKAPSNPKSTKRASSSGKNGAYAATNTHRSPLNLFQEKIADQLRSHKPVRREPLNPAPTNTSPSGYDIRALHDDNDDEKGKRKKQKLYPYEKDDRNYEFYRNPNTLTLQLESSDSRSYIRPKRIKYKLPINQLFQKHSHNSDTSHIMSDLQEIINSSPESLKIYPIDFKNIALSELSLLKWYNMEAKHDLLGIFSDSSPAVQRRFGVDNDLENNAMLIYTSGLEYLKNPKSTNVNQLIDDLKLISQGMTVVEPRKAVGIGSKVEIFLNNAYNITATKTLKSGEIFDKFSFIVMFFPLLQLHILNEVANMESDRVNLEKIWNKNLKLYFEYLTKLWSARSVNNILVNSYEKKTSLMYDIILILKHLCDMRSANLFWNVVNHGLMKSFKISRISNTTDYILLFSNFNTDAVSWRTIDFLVQKVNSLNGTKVDETEIYNCHKIIFETVHSLMTDYNWIADDGLFKSLVKLLKKRNFVNFSAERLSIKIFDKLDMSQFKHKDTLCNWFIKLVMMVVQKNEDLSKPRINFSRLVHFFEPNSSVFSDPTKPDVFLQTFINKINICIMSNIISRTSNYTNSIIKLTKSVIIQDDLLCYQKAFEGLACFYRSQQHKSHISKIGNTIFEECINGMIKKFAKFIKNNDEEGSANFSLKERKYLDIFTDLFNTLTGLALSSTDLISCCELYLYSVGSPKLFQLPYFEFSQWSGTLTKLMLIIIKSSNRFIFHTKKLIPKSDSDAERYKTISNVIRDNLWTPMINLVKISADDIAYVPPGNHICELVCCLGATSDLLVELKCENWQSLNFKWNLYNIDRYELVWLSQVLKFNGQISMLHDADYFIDSFAKSIIRYEPKEFSFLYYQQLVLNDKNNNDWLSFKNSFGNIFDFSNTKRLEILATFISTIFRNSHKSRAYENRANQLVDIMIEEFKKEYEMKKKNMSNTAAGKLKTMNYYKFATKVLNFLNFPSGKKLLQKSKDFQYLKHVFRIARSIVFEGPELQRKIQAITDDFVNDSESISFGSDELFVFLSEQLCLALIENKQDEFVRDLTTTVINLQKEVTYDVEAKLTALDSKLYMIIGLITIEVNLCAKFGDDIWILLHYSLKVLNEVLENSGPFDVNDYWLIFRFIVQFEPLYKNRHSKAMSQSSSKHLFFKIGTFKYLYLILETLFNFLAGQEELQLFISIINIRTRFLEEDFINSQYSVIFLDENIETNLFGDAISHTRKKIKDDEFSSIVDNTKIQNVKKIVSSSIIQLYDKNDVGGHDGANLPALIQIEREKLLAAQQQFLLHFNPSESDSKNMVLSTILDDII
ncbi:hypothetical protein DASC09_025970 [Saccharomycopsis crataegensis]|uniref:Uncharacterized protein n=1 Tax=Saccharomycopsis crataegensis TaxID=43959 RepID=A0AAV5QL40_9ASCO|nr:hypothetical protein DASC09_025970 [Saccharomycopsis crataegensis]